MQPKTLLFLLVPMLFSTNLFSQDGIKPIIDMHLHDYSEKTYRPRPLSANGISSPKTYGEFKKEMLTMFKKYNIVKAMVDADRGEHHLDAEGILYPGYSTGAPPSIEDTVEFKRMIEAGEIKVFGEIGAVYVGKTLADPGYDPFLNICNRYNIPVAIHTGGGPPNVTSFSPKFRIPKGDPYTIEEVINKYPNLKIYMMHAGTSYYEHTLELMRTYPSVYVDLGVILWWDKPEMDFAEAFLRKAKRYGYIDRVMFGSDPMQWPGAIEKSIQTLNGYDFLSEEDKRKIFYENAVRFLELTEEDLKGK